MGNFLSTRPPCSILDIIKEADVTGLTTTGNTTKSMEEMENELKSSYNIVKQESCTEAEMRNVFEWVCQPEFWVKNHALFPTSKRVKTWLWIHSRYRSQSQELRTKAQEYTTKAQLRQLYDSFIKFDAKIKAHSKFEDEQLFKYFLENCSSSEEVQSKLKALSKEHSDLKDTERVRNAFQKVLGDKEVETTDLREMQDALDDYVQDLEKHLQEEEHAIVPIWLNLTSEEYATYRTYLSWKYAFMY